MFRVPKCIGTVVLISIPLLAQKSSSLRADYEKQLSALQVQEKSLREQIAQEQTAILELKTKIDASRKRTAALHRQNLALLGISDNDLLEYSEKLGQLDKGVQRLSAGTDGEILADTVLYRTYSQQAIEVQRSAISRLRSSKAPLAAITHNLAELERRYSLLREQRAGEVLEMTATSPAPTAPVPEPVQENSYTVSSSGGKPETLFSIAEKVYGDPYKWNIIYQANKSVLDRNFNRFQKRAEQKAIVEPSDLIFPGQVLAIPR